MVFSCIFSCILLCWVGGVIVGVFGRIFCSTSWSFLCEEISNSRGVSVVGFIASGFAGTMVGVVFLK